jgi:hypothetical protein
MTTEKQKEKFPEVAILRMGKPKQKREKMVGSEKKIYEVVGPDLNNKMRVHFMPGTDPIIAAWEAAGHDKDKVIYGKDSVLPFGYEIERLRAVVPSRSVFSSWEYYNETYDAAGRRIAQADKEHYIMLKINGEYIVRDGKPFKKFTPGDTVEYDRDGKHYSLKMKANGKLRIVAEDMLNTGNLVQFILKTTSYYSCENIDAQLKGIQGIAETVNGGNAGGVPFEIFRLEQQICWNKPDGSAQRVKKWLINIQADPKWVIAAFRRMSQFALTGETVAGALMPPAEVVGHEDPDEEEFDIPEDGEILDGVVLPDIVPETDAERDAVADKSEMVEARGEWAVNHAAAYWNISIPEACAAIDKKYKGKVKKDEFMTFVRGA